SDYDKIKDAPEAAPFGPCFAMIPRIAAVSDQVWQLLRQINSQRNRAPTPSQSERLRQLHLNLTKLWDDYDRCFQEAAFKTPTVDTTSPDRGCPPWCGPNPAT